MSARWNDSTAQQLADAVASRPPRPVRPGRQVRGLRAERHLSRADVARASGFTIRELARMERGRREMSYDDWRALAGGLGVDVREIAPDDILATERSSTLPAVEDDADDEPLELVDLELDLFIEQIRDDVRDDEIVIADALAALDLDGTAREGHRSARRSRRRSRFRASDQVRRDFALLEEQCQALVDAGVPPDSPVMASDILMVVARLRSELGVIDLRESTPSPSVR